MIRFDCQMCKRHIYNVVLEEMPDPPLCLMCKFISDQPPEVREELLAWQKKHSE